MKNFWAQNKKFIILLTAVTFSLVIALCGSVYLMKKNRYINDEIRKKTAEYEENQRRVGNIETMRAHFDTIKKDEDKLNLFVSLENPVGLIEEIEGIAADTNNKITIEIPEEKEKTKNIAETKKTDKEENELKFPGEKYIKIKISLEGDYQGLARFMKKIENIKYHSDIISLKISKSNNMNNHSAYSLEDAFLTKKQRVVNEEVNSDPKTLHSILETVFYFN